MKYTDRKKTPLKWHRAVSFVLMPLLLIGIVYLLLCMVNELFALHLSWLPAIFAPLLKFVNPGLSITNLGSMFWPVTGAFFLTVLILILAVYVWIGFLRWKNYAKNLWLFYLLIRTICMFAGIVLLITKSGTIQALRMFAAFDSMSRTLLHVFYALFIVIGLWNLIFLILNLMYYHKRKLLFKADYIQPSQESETSVSSPETKQSGNLESTENDKSEPVSVSQDNIHPDQNDQPESDEAEEKENDSSQTPESIKEESDNNQKPDSDESEVPHLSDENQSDHPESDEAEEKENNSTQTPESIKEESENDQKQAMDEKKSLDLKTPEENEPDKTESDRDPNQVYCPYCGAKLGKYDVIYCSHCGRKLV